MSNIDELAEAYLGQLELDAKNNCKFQQGMMVAILGCYIGYSNERHELGLGRIISENGSTWDERQGNHIYTVFLFEDNIIRKVFQQDLERFYLDGNYRKSIIRGMRNAGRGSGHVR